jgi:hypothetical protein
MEAITDVLESEKERLGEIYAELKNAVLETP